MNPGLSLAVLRISSLGRERLQDSHEVHEAQEDQEDQEDPCRDADPIFPKGSDLSSVASLTQNHLVAQVP